MASVVLSAAGAAIGSSLAPAGIGFLGTNLSGAALGNALGSAAGSLIDQSLFGTTATREGPRLSDLSVQGSTEGAAIPRVFGRVRLAGQLIWSTQFKETATTSSNGGGKGSGSGSQTETTTYSYAVSFAVALCEGPITRIGRIWADGNLLDLSQISFRVHEGTETQLPDSTIEAVEGAGAVSAYRGVAYVVFDDLALSPFGNRLPQLTFEVFRALGDIEQNIRAVTIIPGATEFGYDTVSFRRIYADGVSETENVNNQIGTTDWTVSLDDLQATCPNCNAVALVSTWYGDDLRAGHCTLRPKVDTSDKVSIPEGWSVAGQGRTAALTVSTVNGKPAFGGTPSDASVKRAIADLTSRGLSVLFNPFLMMDIPAGNGLPDPYGASEQANYPWRGRISVAPAPGFVGSPDKTPAIAAEVLSFFGTASAIDFSIGPAGITYSGPDEWSYRRMVLHNAALCVWAGGVDGFLIGSELRGLTQLRDSAATYPAVAQLVLLSSEVRALLGPNTKISYGADWSEYFGHQPADGSGDVFFHLDPLWAHDEIDFVGIDNYCPLADWRDDPVHADQQAGFGSPYDLSYLQGNIAGGEGFDWYYANETDRAAQTRTPISDGAYGKPWVFRYKDLVNWWGQQHYNRPGGVEQPIPTGWVPQSKQICFTELGCPAIDKGANQPNVFVDAKSSESASPYFSTGQRDDYAQRRFLQAHLDYWRADGPGFSELNNPVSTLTGKPMLDIENSYIWTWDARPFPSFPSLTAVWSDGENWKLGHWITGRLGAVPLGLLVKTIAAEVGKVPLDIADLTGTLDGFVIDRIMSARQALEPLMLAYFFDVAETEGQIKFRHIGTEPVATLTPDDLAVEPEQANAGFRLVRGQETELPYSVKLTYIDPDIGYRQAAVEARRQVVQSDRVSSAALPIVMGQREAQRIADTWLHDTWVKRERATLRLPPSKAALNPGDTVKLVLPDRDATYRLTSLDDAGAIDVEAVCEEAKIFGLTAGPERVEKEHPVLTFGPPDLVFLDLPLLTGDETPYAPHVAAMAKPWPGGVAVYRSSTGSGFSLNLLLENPATMGRTVTSLSEGPLFRWDRGNTFQVSLGSGELESVDETAVLAGANLAALQNPAGGWEVIQFATATLLDVNTYELSDLLRGQGGTEAEMQSLLAAGARFVLLNADLAQVNISAAEWQRAFHWRFGPQPYRFDHVAYTTTIAGFQGVGARPLSPVHLKANRQMNEDIALAWIRRTRLGGDNWAAMDVPLGEEREAYEIDIMEGEIVRRTIETSTAAATYSAAEQVADFGNTTFSTLSVRVFQVSPAYGRGAAAAAQFSL